MGKKKLRAKYTSKGERKANKKISNAVRRDRSPIQTEIDKMDSFLAGKKVYFTHANPTAKTNRPFIRYSGKDLYGDWRNYHKGERNQYLDIITKQGS